MHCICVTTIFLTQPKTIFLTCHLQKVFFSSLRWKMTLCISKRLVFTLIAMFSLVNTLLCHNIKQNFIDTQYMLMFPIFLFKHGKVWLPSIARTRSLITVRIPGYSYLQGCHGQLHKLSKNLSQADLKFIWLFHYAILIAIKKIKYFVI